MPDLADVAKEDVDVPWWRGGLVHQLLDLGLIGDVAVDVLAPVMTDWSRHILAQFVLDVGYDDGRAMLREEAGACFPHSSSSAGDDRNLSLQPADHIYMIVRREAVGVGNSNVSIMWLGTIIFLGSCAWTWNFFLLVWRSWTVLIITFWSGETLKN